MDAANPTKELEMDWFDAVAIDESQIEDLEANTNHSRALAKAARKMRP